MNKIKELIQTNVSLSHHSTFRVGGPAAYFANANTLDELTELIRWAQTQKHKYIILGGGSNVLFMDEGYDGLVIKLQNDGCNVLADGRLKVGAGVPLAQVVTVCHRHGLMGFEWAAGIPGSVGGAIRGNAGAFGGEMKDAVISVSAVDTTHVHPSDDLRFDQKILSNDECLFGYRTSIFKQYSGLIVWEVTFDLPAGDAVHSMQKIQQNIAHRRVKHPHLGKFPSAGSTFQNPQVGGKVARLFEVDREVQSREGKVPSGWLIDQCDLKGKKIGGAMVSTQQANFIVNTGNATAKDIIMLMSIIKQKVRNTFGVQLKEEIEIVY